MVAITALVTSSSGASASATASADVPAGILWQPAPHNDWTAASRVTIGGKPYFPESAETPHSLQISTNTDKPIARFEVRNGELWPAFWPAGSPYAGIYAGGNDTERSELDGTPTLYPKGTDIWVASSIKIEPGPPMITTAGGFIGGPLVWGSLMQLHGDGVGCVPWQVSFVGETLSIRTQRDPNQLETIHWTMPNFVRGQVYDVVARVKITGTSTSTMTTWVDGVQVCNVTNLVIGSNPGSNNHYLKVGIYRGWENNGFPPLVVYHANVEQQAASLLSRVSNRPSWPVLV